MVEPLEMDMTKPGFGTATRSFGRFARSSSTSPAEQTSDLEDAAVDTAERQAAKKPDPNEESIAECHGAFTSMNDKGLSLLRQRERSTDRIELVELLVNSIANTPKSCETDFEEIGIHKAQFVAAEEFARKDLDAARKSAAGATVGGCRGRRGHERGSHRCARGRHHLRHPSTGTAISSLSGAAVTNAVLAWLGGGVVAAGGGGAATGGALRFARSYTLSREIDHDSRFTASSLSGL